MPHCHNSRMLLSLISQSFHNNQHFQMQLFLANLSSQELYQMPLCRNNQLCQTQPYLNNQPCHPHSSPDNLNSLVVVTVE
jgi:hypothetical protein